MADNDDVLNWSDVKRRLSPLGRGTPYRLAQALGMNSSYFYRKLGTDGDLSATQRRKVLDFLAGADPAAAGPPPAVGNQGLVPVFGYAATGGGDRILLTDDAIMEWMRLPMGLEVSGGDWLVVKGLGTSMEPRIFAGDPLLIRRNYPAAKDKDVLVEFSDGTAVIKTFEGERQGRVFVKQWNDPRVLDFDATTVRALHGGIVKL